MPVSEGCTRVVKVTCLTRLTVAKFWFGVFADLEIVGYFSNGNDLLRDTLFQITSSLDGFVLQYIGK